MLVLGWLTAGKTTTVKDVSIFLDLCQCFENVFTYIVKFVTYDKVVAWWRHLDMQDKALDIGSPDIFGDIWGQKLILLGNFWG